MHTSRPLAALAKTRVLMMLLILSSGRLDRSEGSLVHPEGTQCCADNRFVHPIYVLQYCSVLREDGLISPSGGLDWFEGAIAHPEGVLEDLNTALKAPTSTVSVADQTSFVAAHRLPRSEQTVCTSGAATGHLRTCSCTSKHISAVAHRQW